MHHFVPSFETGQTIVALRPWPEIFEFKHTDWPHAHATFFGLHLHARANAKGTPQLEERGSEGSNDCAPNKKAFDLRVPIVNFLKVIRTWHDTDKFTNSYDLVIRHMRLSELREWRRSWRQGLPLDCRAPNQE